MKKNKLIIVGIVAIAVIIGLYTISNNSGKKAHTHQEENAMEMPSGASANPMAAVPPASFDSLLEVALLKLSPKDREKFQDYQNTLNQADTEEQIDIYEDLGQFWRNKNRRIAAHYFIKSGELDNSEKKLNFASHILSEELHTEDDPAIRNWMSAEAIKGFKKSLEINPNNDTVKIDYALFHIDLLGQPMEGIQILLEMVEKDPDNIPVNIILGKMAIESGQLDKAIERGQHVLRLDPKNLEGHLFLGEAYKRHNEIDKAIETFTAAKSLLDHPDFARDIDEYIESFKD